MKKRTSNVSRRIVSLLLSLVLALTLVTPRGLCHGGGGRQRHDHRRGRYEPG